MSTPRTDAKLIESYGKDGKLVVSDRVYATFARRLEVELNAALNEIGELRRVIVELTAAGNCVESDKLILRTWLKEKDDVYCTIGNKSTDNWNKAKDWDRRNK